MKNFKIYDTFIFFNELDLLEIRLNILCDVVDYFVLVEATKTFQNNSKELYYENNKHRFDKFKDKIIHIIIDDLPNTDKPFEIEAFHRNGIKKGLIDCCKDDIVIVSDLDEIPNPITIQKNSQKLEKGLLYLVQPLYYYYLNYACNELDNLPWSVMCKYKDFTEAQVLRNGVIDIQNKLLSNIQLDDNTKLISNGGWHFSYLGGVEEIIKKIESFAHDEYNNTKFKDKEKIEIAILKGKDLFGRDLNFKYTELNESFPKFIIDNKLKYKSLILNNYKEKQTMLFDQFSRYNALKQILNKLEFDEGKTLLDIGSGPECLLGSILDSENITYLDPLLSKENNEKYIKGNIFSDKLNNRKFDFVTAIDVLEHIPFAIRNSFIERLCELTDNCVVLAFPTSENIFSTQIDESVNENYKKIYGVDYPWLEEHFTYTLPSLEETKTKFEALGWKCSTIGHGYAPWLEEMMNIVIPSWDRLELHDVLLEMSRKFNESFAEYDFNAPYYREFLIVSKHQLPELSSFVKNIDNEVEVKYQNLVRDTREALFAESLKIISKKDKNIQELNKNIQDVSAFVHEEENEILLKDEIILEKEKQIQEVSNWGQELQKQIVEKDQLILKQNEQIQEVSNWALSLKKQLEESKQ